MLNGPHRAAGSHRRRPLSHRPAAGDAAAAARSSALSLGHTGPALSTVPADVGDPAAADDPFARILLTDLLDRAVTTRRISRVARALLVATHLDDKPLVAVSGRHRLGYAAAQRCRRRAELTLRAAA